MITNSIKIRVGLRTEAFLSFPEVQRNVIGIPLREVSTRRGEKSERFFSVGTSARNLWFSRTATDIWGPFLESPDN